MPDEFYSTAEWQKARAKTKARWKRGGLPCAYCKQPLDWSAKRGVTVDHIKNRRQFPLLALDEQNLQCVHSACNTRKAAWSENSKTQEVGIDGFAIGSEWA